MKSFAFLPLLLAVAAPLISGERIHHKRDLVALDPAPQLASTITVNPGNVAAATGAVGAAAAAASVVNGQGSNAQGQPCNCMCLCGSGQAPANAGIGAFGGIVGTLPEGAFPAQAAVAMSPPPNAGAGAAAVAPPPVGPAGVAPAAEIPPAPVAGVPNARKVRM